MSQALEIQPDDAETNYSLGMLYTSAAESKWSDPRLSAKALDISLTILKPVYNLGVLFVRGQKSPLRLKINLKPEFRVAPNFDQSYLNLARLYAMRSDKGKVILDLLPRAA